MFLKRKRLMDPGGWALQILCNNSKEFALAKFFLNHGKCTQLKANGMGKQMEVNAQSILSVKRLRISKRNNLSNKDNTFKWNLMIDGSTTLSTG